MVFEAVGRVAACRKSEIEVWSLVRLIAFGKGIKMSQALRGPCDFFGARRAAGAPFTIEKSNRGARPIVRQPPGVPLKKLKRKFPSGSPRLFAQLRQLSSGLRTLGTQLPRAFFTAGCVADLLCLEKSEPMFYSVNVERSNDPSIERSIQLI